MLIAFMDIAAPEVFCAGFLDEQLKKCLSGPALRM